MKVSLQDILDAKKNIQKDIKNTEASYSESLKKLLGFSVSIKYENAQKTGSFKIRGALNKILSLSEAEKKKGVVASSAGNHAQGVAFSATKVGVKSTIVMPVTAPLIKVQATKEYGAHVVQHGEIYDEAYEKALEIEKTSGAVFVHPFEDPKIIAGQGTIGLEILEQVPQTQAIVVPIGGGGLISGVAIAAKALNPKIKIFGVQSSQTPGMENLFHQKAPSEYQKRITTIADGIAVKKPSQSMYDNFIKKYVDEIVTVSDDEIAESIVYLMERMKTVAEGAGGAALAALLNKKLPAIEHTCVLVCGGNVDLNVISKVLEKGRIKKGRLVELSVVVEDLPGTLHRLTKVIADNGANILEVHHDRVNSGLYLRETRIDFVLETTSHEHVEKIKSSLQDLGARIL
jgi:threonine dehydratase